ncbi:2-succinyl-5-enolpyruvyl-6-hydroxy-3-cyclohexene-1-carboxylic-acid synthase [Rothia aeria]|uniref:2-succinyl-5-enolpyruvyl-6-hydroxy-3-cyclohexene-1-carboxylic-acid synthase n=1 Tax=Rothia aeria TaxID=172042 RepID=A0A2Z5R2L0_9MICC|nr:2-succinyl-5-enolpyruvyl-6-hydroxy-3-cyclohexene-1-carboxylic-acid synthase [Rothia aeria]
MQHKTAQAEAACGAPLLDAPQAPKTVVVAGTGPARSPQSSHLL